MSPPREGWVTLVDSEGREVVDRAPVVLGSGTFNLTFWTTDRFTVTHLRFIDIDGTVHDTRLTWGQT